MDEGEESFGNPETKEEMSVGKTENICPKCDGEMEWEIVGKMKKCKNCGYEYWV